MDDELAYKRFRLEAGNASSSKDPGNVCTTCAQCGRFPCECANSGHSDAAKSMHHDASAVLTLYLTELGALRAALSPMNRCLDAMYSILSATNLQLEEMKLTLNTMTSELGAMILAAATSGGKQVKKHEARIKKQRIEIEKQEARIEKQRIEAEKEEARIKEQRIEIEKQEARIEQQEARIRDERIVIEKQNARIKELRIEAEKQEARIKELRIEAEKQEARIKEQRIEEARIKNLFHFAKDEVIARYIASGCITIAEGMLPQLIGRHCDTTFLLGHLEGILKAIGGRTGSRQVPCSLACGRWYLGSRQDGVLALVPR